MARVTIEKQYERYLNEYRKREAKANKYNLKVAHKEYTLKQFETEAITKRYLKVKDVSLSIAKEQTQPFTDKQLRSMAENSMINVNGKYEWSNSIKKIANELNIDLKKYDSLLNPNAHDRSYKLAKFINETYKDLKSYLEVHPGETEALSELIGESFWGS